MVRVDSQKVMALKQGDQAAFSDIYCAYRDLIYNLIYDQVDDDTQASDYTKDTFLRLLETITEFNEKEENFHYWFLSVISRSYIFQLKHEFNKTPFIELASAITQIDEYNYTYPLSDKLNRMKKELGLLDYNIYLYKVAFKLSYEDMSDVIGLSQEELKTRFEKISINVRKITKGE